MAKHARKFTAVIMVDMSKAFDRVQHQRLLSVLHQHGLGGSALQWFASYLSNRQQKIRVGDSLSAPVACSRGVPQGSVLGPLLFILYTSQLSKVLPPAICHQEFVDDIVLDYSHHDPQVVGTTLSTAISELADWLQDIGLVLNSAKTQVMCIQPRGEQRGIPPISCHDQPLAVTANAKYLGVTIDNGLTFEQHVDTVQQKVASAVGQLWRHGRGLSLRARRMWYIGIVQSKLTYGSNCFFPSLTQHLRNRLLKSSKSGIRAIFQVPRRTSTHPLIARISLSPLSDIFVHKLLQFVFRCLLHLSSPLFNTFFH